MAGTYPDVPGYRFAYDKDGTTMLIAPVTSGVSTIIQPSQATFLNSISDGNTGSQRIDTHLNGGTYVVLLFPEVRNISGYFIHDSSSSGNGRVEVSTSSNTTNGIDGAWTIQQTQYVGTYNSNNGGNPTPFNRTAIQAVNWNAVTAVRFNIGGLVVWHLHLYGSIATTNSPDRLRIVDLSGNDIAAQLDFGDIRQRNNSTKQFQVVNNSSTLTANNITVTLDVPTDASPTLVGQYQLSTDNTAYANAINIGTLAPGASSSTLYVRDTVNATAQLGPWSLRLIASANTWS